MSAIRNLQGKSVEEATFSDMRFGDKTGFIGISDLKVGKLYETQYGETRLMSHPYDDFNPVTSEKSKFVDVRIMNGCKFYNLAIDLVWIGVIPTRDGLWRQDAVCYEFLHNLHGELID